METQVRGATSLSDAVAKEIRIALIRADLKQSDLAARMHRSEMWVSRRLRGAQPIDLNDLQQFADALGVKPSDLLTGAVVSSSGISGQTTVAELDQPKRPILTGQPKRAAPPKSSRRPARITPLIAELMSDGAMSELLDARAA